MAADTATNPTVGGPHDAVINYLETIGRMHKLPSTKFSNIRIIQLEMEANNTRADQTTSAGEVGQDVRIIPWKAMMLNMVVQSTTAKMDEEGGTVGDFTLLKRAAIWTPFSPWTPPWPPPSPPASHRKTTTLDGYNEDFSEYRIMDICVYKDQRHYTAGDGLYSIDNCQGSKFLYHSNDFDSDESTDPASTAGFGESYAPPSEEEVVGRML